MRRHRTTVRREKWCKSESMRDGRKQALVAKHGASASRLPTPQDGALWLEKGEKEDDPRGGIPAGMRVRRSLSRICGFCVSILSECVTQNLQRKKACQQYQACRHVHVTLNSAYIRGSHSSLVTLPRFPAFLGHLMVCAVVDAGISMVSKVVAKSTWKLGPAVCDTAGGFMPLVMLTTSWCFSASSLDVWSCFVCDSCAWSVSLCHCPCVSVVGTSGCKHAAITNFSVELIRTLIMSGLIDSMCLQPV